MIVENSLSCIYAAVDMIQARAEGGGYEGSALRFGGCGDTPHGALVGWLPLATQRSPRVT